MNADIKAVEATVRTYLDGLYEGDADKLAHVFHTTSALTTARDDGAIQIVQRGVQNPNPDHDARRRSSALAASQS